jgi:hypothetical protein
MRTSELFGLVRVIGTLFLFVARSIERQPPRSGGPGTEVAYIGERNGNGELEAVLSDGTRLDIDQRSLPPDTARPLENVPYLGGLLDRIKRADGFPVLDEAFQTTVPGLYIPGFSATNDFGPFFGFVKGCPAAATLIVRDLLKG